MVDLILKKKYGGELTKEEIRFIIQGYTGGTIPDYQIASWLMAIYFKGMTAVETAELTLSMVASGDTVDLSEIKGIKVDKHSTGGVGDTTSLMLVPLVACTGIPMAKMTGRGLGHTGGTVDKLESIPGFNTKLDTDQFIRAVQKVGAAIIGQTKSLVPADGKLYALRDVTGTVDSIPLIASSIMSKKIASGSDAIVLDVKTGNGAFMKSLDDSFALAQAMVDIGTNVGKRVVALVTDMGQPLGMSVGNALEVVEAIRVLKGEIKGPLRDVVLTIGSYLVTLADKAKDIAEAKKLLESFIDNGKAIEKFREIIEIQGGNGRVVDDIKILPQAKKTIEIKALKRGYIHSIDTEHLGRSAMVLGAGRETKESSIDLAVGIVLKKRLADRIEKGETLAVFYVNDESKLDQATEMLHSAYHIEDKSIETPKLIFGVVTKDGIQRL